MKKITLTVLAAAMLPSVSLAQDQNSYQCSNGDLQRRVEIAYPAGATVPCEVHYYKDTEAPGEQQVLWRAAQEQGYCERKSLEFVAKLTAWGWSCDQQDGGAVSDDADANDQAEASAAATEPEAAEDS